MFVLNKLSESESESVVCLTQYATFVARKDTSKQPASPSRGHPRSPSSQRLPSTL